MALRGLFGVAVATAVLLVWPSPASADALSCDGPFAKEASHASLVEAFGPENAVMQQVAGAEGETTMATVLFPNDPKRRLEVFWTDEAAHSGPTIVIGREAKAWSFGEIAIGTKMAEIEAMNGGPFKLFGFDWDYGGRSSDWQGGKLSKPLEGGCRVSFGFSYPENADDQFVSKVVGDSEFSSDNPNMRKIEPFVTEIMITYVE